MAETWDTPPTPEELAAADPWSTPPTLEEREKALQPASFYVGKMPAATRDAIRRTQMTEDEPLPESENMRVSKMPTPAAVKLALAPQPQRQPRPQDQPQQSVEPLPPTDAQRVADLPDVASEQPIRDVRRLTSWRMTQKVDGESPSTDVLRYAAEAQLPPDFVAKNFDALKPALERQHLELALDQAPRLNATLFSNPQIAIAAKDDLPALSWMERNLTGKWETHAAPPDYITGPDADYARAHPGEMPWHEMTYRPLWMLAAVKAGQGTLLSLKRTRTAMNLDAAEIGSLHSPEEVAQNQKLVAASEASELETAKDVAETERQMGPLSLAQKIALGPFTMAPYLVGLTVAARAGGLPGAFAWNWSQSYGNDYRHFKEMQKADGSGELLHTDEEARALAGTTANISSGLMTLLDVPLLKGMPFGEAIAQRMTGQAIGEALGETGLRQLGRELVRGGVHLAAGASLMATTAAVERAAEYRSRVGHGEQDDAADVVREGIRGFVQSIPDFLLMSAWAPGRALIDETGRQFNSVRESARLKQAVDTARDSLFVKNNAGGSADKVLGDQAAGTDAKTVYVTLNQWDNYWKAKGLDPAEVAGRVMNDGGEGYATATRGKGDLPIPIERYLTQLAPKGHADAFEQHVKLSPDGLTPAEYIADLEQRAKAGEEGAPAVDAFRAVYENERQKQIAGGASPREAEGLATLVARAYTRFAEREGKGRTALDIQQQFPISIGKGAMATEPGLAAAASEARAASDLQQRGEIRALLASLPAGATLDDLRAKLEEGAPEPGTGGHNLETLRELFDNLPHEATTDDLRRSLSGEASTGQDVISQAQDKVAVLRQSAALRTGRENLDKYGLEPEGRHTTRDIARALEKRTREKYGVTARDDYSIAASKRIAKMMADEVRYEHKPENIGSNGVGWYGKKYQQALDEFSKVFPELKKDKNARDVFTALVAITSDGQKVYTNFRMASELYAEYRKTGRLPDEGTANYRGGKNSNIARINQLLEQRGPAGMKDFLLQERTVSELKKLAKADGTDFSVDYKADTKLPMAALVFGPKLGAFYANLMGSHGYLTMDRWWSRTFNRYRGTLLPKPTEVGLARFRELLSKPGLTDAQTIKASIPHHDTYEAKGFKNGSEIEKAANTIYKAAFQELEDVPFNASDREFMIRTAEHARKLLKKSGIDISTADVQAVLWYYEKRLYGDLGARQTADVSYADVARRVASERADAAGLPEPGGPAAQVGGEPAVQGPAADTQQAGAAGRAEGGVVLKQGALALEHPHEAENEEFRPTTPDAFEKAKAQMTAAKPELAANLSPKSPEEYAHLTPHLTEDGKTGYAITDDGDLVNVFNNGGRPGAGREAVAAAVAKGGARTLDCYDGFLPQYYAQFGFTETGRMKFADEHAPAGWDLEKQGRPDIVFMTYNDGDPATIADRIGTFPPPAKTEVLENDWEEAKLRARSSTSHAVPEGQGATAGAPGESAGLAPEHGGTANGPGSAGREARIRPVADLDGATASVDVRRASQTSRLNEGERGSVRISAPTAAGSRAFEINLNNPDRSTRAHELFHAFSVIMGDLAQHGTPELKADYDTMLKHMGYESHEQRLATFDPAKEEIASHQWEQYLRDGKAPVPELAGVFQRFKDWLLKIYRGAEDLSAQYRAHYGKDLPVFSQDMRDVFDRMLASTEEIAAARGKQGADGFTDALKAKLPEAARAGLGQDTAVTLTDQEESLLRRIKTAQDARGALDRERQRVTDDVTREVNGDPAQRALHFFKTGEVRSLTGEVLPFLTDAFKNEDGSTPKLDRQILTDRYGKDFADSLPKDIVRHGGVDPDFLSSAFGFGSGDEMVHALAVAPDAAEAIASETQQRMAERYPTLLNDPQKMAEAALDSVHNDKQATQIVKELRLLAEHVDPTLEPKANAINLASMRAVAARVIAAKAVGEIDPNYYLQSERSASTRALEAMRKGDAATAFGERSAQLLNLFLWREARDAKSATDKAISYLRDRVDNKSRALLGRAGKEYLDGTDGVLQAVGLTPQTQDPNRLGIDSTVQRMIDDGAEVAFDPDQIRALVAQPKDWKKLTPGELDNVLAAVKNIRKAARDVNEVTLQGQKLDLRNLASSLDMQASALNKDRGPQVDDRSAIGRAQKLKDGARAFDVSALRPESIWSQLGDIGKRVFGGYIDARNYKEKLAGEMLKWFEEQFDEKMPEEVRKGRNQLVDVDKDLPANTDTTDLGGPRTRRWLWMVALNSGTPGNLERMTVARGWTEDGVRRALSKLTKPEADFLQSILDYSHEKLGPLLSEKEARKTGLPLKMVETAPFGVTLADGSKVNFEGYFPAKYDPRVSKRGLGAQQASQEGVASFYGSDYRRAQTPNSFTKTRAQTYSNIVNLNWSVYPGHIAQVLHDIAFDEYVRDTARILNNDQVQRTLRHYSGIEAAQELRTWLKVVATQQTGSVPAAAEKALGPVFGWLRSRVVMSSIVGSAPVLISQVAHPLIAAAGGELGAAHASASLAKALLPDVRAFMLANVPELQHREARAVRALQERLREIGVPDQGMLGTATRIAEHGMHIMDGYVSTAVAIAAMNDAKALGLKDGAEFAYASDKVRQLMPTHEQAEMPSLLRDRGLVGSLLMAHGFQNTLYNVARNMWHSDGAAKATGKILAMTLFSGVAGGLLLGHGKQDDETWGEWMLRKAIAAPFELIPFLPNLTEPAADYLVTGSVKKADIRNAPVLAGAQTILEGIGKLASDSASDDDKVWAAVELALFGAKLPARQFGRTGRYLWDEASDDVSHLRLGNVASGIIHGPAATRRSATIIDAGSDFADTLLR